VDQFRAAASTASGTADTVCFDSPKVHANLATLIKPHPRLCSSVRVVHIPCSGLNRGIRLFLLSTGHAPSAEMPLLSYLRLMHLGVVRTLRRTVNDCYASP